MAVITLQGQSKLYAAIKGLSNAVMRSPEARLVNLRAAEECQLVIRRHTPISQGGRNISYEKGWPSIHQSVEVRQKGMPAYVKYNNQKNPFGYWLEYGTEERKHKSGKKVGRMTATNWFSKGRNASRVPVRRALRAGYRAVILFAAEQARLKSIGSSETVRFT